MLPTNQLIFEKIASKVTERERMDVRHILRKINDEIAIADEINVIYLRSLKKSIVSYL